MSKNITIVIAVIIAVILAIITGVKQTEIIDLQTQLLTGLERGY